MNWSLVKRNISELKPFENNPRRMTDKGMKDLKQSIQKFGIAEPIVINTDNKIIGGHARYYALQNNGLEEIDCYIPERTLTEKEVKELNVRLNKNIAGEWDFDILANAFELPDLLEWGFDEKEMFGSTVTDADWADAMENKGNNIPDDLKHITFVIPTNKVGDLRKHLKNYAEDKDIALIKWLDSSLNQ